MSTPVLDCSALRRAFGAFPTGVVAVAALGDNGPVGLAASSFTSVSLEPAIVSVNIASTSKTLPALRKHRHWGISVLAEHQGWIGRQLSQEPDTRFVDVRWRTNDRGGVVLEDAAAHFSVRVDTFVRAGDHDIVLLHVEDLHLDVSSSPLVFHASKFRQLRTP